MTIGVFGGSFNPVHNGHLALAREVVRRGLSEKVLMVLSPLNPLKEHPEALVADEDRLAMLRLACEPYPELEASGIELSMPRPSYTVDTLRRLSRENPAVQFRLIIGADNWAGFMRWREPQEILRHNCPIVYPREGYPLPEFGSGAEAMDAELFPISSTQVRKRLKNGETVNNLIPEAVLTYIKQHGLWKQTQ